MEGQATDGGKQWSPFPGHTLLLQSCGQVCDDLGGSLEPVSSAPQKRCDSVCRHFGLSHLVEEC